MEEVWQEEGTAVSAVTANVSELQAKQTETHTRLHTEPAYIRSLFVMYLQY